MIQYLSSIHETLGLEAVSVIPALKRQSQEEQNSKVILSYTLV